MSVRMTTAPAESTPEALIRLGVIGCGEIATSHALAAIACRRTHLVAGYDLEKERADAFAYRFGCTSASSLQEMFDRVDAVVVCTPPGRHAEVVAAACAAGRHVLCEKELAPDPAHCRVMLDAAARAGVRFAVGFRFRHDPLFQKVQRIICSGEIGTPTLAHLWLPRDLATATHLSASAFPAGVTVGHGCHGYDLMRFLFGAPDDLVGLGANKTGQLVDSDDTAVLAFRWGSTLGTLVIPWSATATDLDRRIEVFGENGHLTADYIGRKIQITGTALARTVRLPSLDVPNGGGARLDFVNQIDDFARSCHDGSDLIAPAVVGADAVIALTTLREHPDWLGGGPDR